MLVFAGGFGLFLRGGQADRIARGRRPHAGVPVSPCRRSGCAAALHLQLRPFVVRLHASRLREAGRRRGVRREAAHQRVKSTCRGCAAVHISCDRDRTPCAWTRRALGLAP